MQVTDETKRAEQLLTGAYSLRTAADNIKYYKDFAGIYDVQYAERMGYSYPDALAQVYRSYQQSTDTPVADIGCGTGLVAIALDLPVVQIDGFDISAQMLNVARGKSIYRTCYEVDLHTGVEGLPCNYGAVVSAGTFTFGHLGPATLRPLLDLAKTGALFCVGINASHFKEAGFKQVFDELVTDLKITSPVFIQQHIYSGQDSDHAHDLATIAVYRKR